MHEISMENHKFFCSILEKCKIKDLIDRETYWINKLNPDLNINSDPIDYTPYITNNRKASKKVYQYSLSGDYIRSYESVSEAARQLNVKSSAIASCARGNVRYKSAYGFIWRYTKSNRIEAYENNSKSAKIVSIYVLDIETLNETKYNSIADAVRTIGIYSNFDSDCAMMSSVANNKQSFYRTRYMIRYENQKYKFSNRKTAVYNTADNKLFTNAKEAAKVYNLNKDTIRKYCSNQINNWIYLEERARLKFRESGKLQYWTTLIEDL